MTCINNPLIEVIQKVSLSLKSIQLPILLLMHKLVMALLFGIMHKYAKIAWLEKMSISVAVFILVLAYTSA